MAQDPRDRMSGQQSKERWDAEQAQSLLMKRCVCCGADSLEDGGTVAMASLHCLNIKIANAVGIVGEHPLRAEPEG